MLVKHKPIQNVNVVTRMVEELSLGGLRPGSSGHDNVQNVLLNNFEHFFACLFLALKNIESVLSILEHFSGCVNRLLPSSRFPCDQDVLAGSS